MPEVNGRKRGGSAPCRMLSRRYIRRLELIHWCLPPKKSWGKCSFFEASLFRVMFVVGQHTFAGSFVPCPTSTRILEYGKVHMHNLEMFESTSEMFFCAH
ncbi:unnamed protein product [Discosporangium mesarthrocarpum]